MAVKPHSIDIVVADMGRALAFYRLLGLDAPSDKAAELNVQIETPGAAAIGLFTERLIRDADPAWVEPVGQRITFACLCDSPAELDAVHARIVAAGYDDVKAPWNTPWGQRYAMVRDADGNRVDLFVPLDPEGV